MKNYKFLERLTLDRKLKKKSKNLPKVCGKSRLFYFYSVQILLFLEISFPLLEVCADANPFSSIPCSIVRSSHVVNILAKLRPLPSYPIFCYSFTPTSKFLLFQEHWLSYFFLIKKKNSTDPLNVQINYVQNLNSYI